MTLTKDTLWLINGPIVVENGAKLTIESGTKVAAFNGLSHETSYLVIDKGAQIIADGTKTEPIIFSSTIEFIDNQEPRPGQWGGILIVGKAGNPQVMPHDFIDQFNTCGGRIDTGCTADVNDSSGVLRFVEVRNAGTSIELSAGQLHGIEFLGVGSGTIVENVKVVNSDEDCIAIWGGSVNLSNIYLENCTDDQLDIDEGYSGTVTNLAIHQISGNAAIEMSGMTTATFDGFNIVQNYSGKDGAIYFKNDYVGGHFKNGTVTDNVNDKYGSIHSQSSDRVSDLVNVQNISFENINLDGNATGPKFTGTSADTLEEIFNNSKLN